MCRPSEDVAVKLMRFGVVAALGFSIAACPAVRETAVLAAAAAGVGGIAAVRERVGLVDAALWQLTPLAADPWPDQPSDPACPDIARMAELLANESVFSVDTGVCRYITAQQPSLGDVGVGDKLSIRVWHFALHADEPASAHVAVRIGATTLLDMSVPIPSPGGLIHVEPIAPVAIPKGTPIYFHLHNHGDNSWSFVELSAGPV